ncbi:N-formylglutamate amidohydrolase [Bifidobacterium sp. SO1]|nr:N-formylglutamate amidohydrolase [Bifidobacterium sp. SO1]
MLIHVPHAGQQLPDTITPDRFADPTAVDHLYRNIRDMHADTIGSELADRLDASMMLNHMSRIWVDVERYPDDREEMNRVGMGVIYTHDMNGRPLYQPGREPDGRERGQRLNRLYRPWHATFTNTIRMMLDIHDRATIIDLHTYPKTPLPFERHRDEPRPQIILGVNNDEPSRRLAILLHKRLHDASLTVGVNTAYKGSITPNLPPDPRFDAIMLEIRQDTAGDRILRQRIIDTTVRTLMEAGR